MVNHLGEVLSVKITTGNVDDRNPVPYMVGALSGKRQVNKGYLGKALASKLQNKGVELITNVRKNIKKVAISKHYLIEKINDQVKTFHMQSTPDIAVLLALLQICWAV